MARKVSEISVTQFKAKCLEIVRRVHDRQAPEIVITKHGRPYVKVVPVDSGKGEVFGYLKGLAKIHGDLTEPIGVEWKANNAESGSNPYGSNSRNRATSASFA
jgi:prevent-host-death family protein